MRQLTVTADEWDQLLSIHFTRKTFEDMQLELNAILGYIFSLHEYMDNVIRSKCLSKELASLPLLKLKVDSTTANMKL